MPSFDQSFSSEPVLVLPPQPSFGMDQRPSFNTPFSNNISQSPIHSAWQTPPQATPVSAAGRKRSRDEAASNLEEDYFPVQIPVTQPAAEIEDEWEYGEGMTLIRKNSNGFVLEAGSQTGTWAEEKAEQEKAKAAAIASLANAPTERPILRAAKSQRLNLSSTPAIPEEFVSNGALVLPDSPERHAGPTVDDFTRHLGIGWSSVANADPDIQAASRGWAKFIENHFPITNVHIRLQSKGLASYLVEANEGYFLFGENLKQGQFVSANLDRVWDNLRGAVPVFDGDVVMEAGETPKVITDSGMLNGVHGMNWMDEATRSTTNGVNAMDTTTAEPVVANGCHHPDVEMDMS